MKNTTTTNGVNKMTKYYTTCECCGKRIDENKAIWDEESNAYCTKCTSEMMAECKVCGKSFPMWEMTSTNDGVTFCENCATAIA